MSKKTAKRLSRSILFLVTGLLLASVPLAISNSTEGKEINPAAAAVYAIAVFWVATGSLVVSRQPGNWSGWIFIAIGSCFPITIFAHEYAVNGLLTRPGWLPGVAVVVWIGEFGLYAVALLPLLFLLFPDGRPPSPRWRWATRGLVGGTAIALVGYLVRPGTFNSLRDYGIRYENPIGVEALADIAGAIIGVGTSIALISAASTVLALRLRYKRSTGMARQQLKWLVFVGSLAGILFALFWTAGLGAEILSLDEEGFIFPAILALLVFTIAVGVPVAYGVAILRYRLYDIDVVINKTLIFGALAAFITAVYVAIVVGVGALFGRGAEPNVGLSIGATAIVAVAFQPVRSRVQHLANRLVYGKRAEPYEVLSQFSERVAGTEATEEVMPRTARVLADGTGAERAEVWLRAGSQLVREATWPESEGARETIQIYSDDLPELPGVTRAIEVRHQGELLGALALVKAPGDPLKPAEEKLLGDLASQAGLVLRNVGLTADLEARLDEISRQAEELRASRQRIIEAQDTERRKLERNIHDGAQQHLVALAVKLRLAKSLAEKDPQKARALLRELQSETTDALDTLRDLARGIYPPLLEEKGVAAALEGQAAKGTTPVTIESEGISRAPLEAEGTVYFCCLEALQNIGKYANASRAVVRLGRHDGQLTFSVEDDGDGFDPATQPAGSGLQNMRDRVEALGGSVRVDSTPGKGTTVSGRVPAGDLERVG